MVGKRTWQKYSADNGAIYTVDIDQSNGLALGFTEVQNSDPVYPMLPSRFKMRRIVVRHKGTGQPRSFPIGNPSHPAYLGTAKEVQIEGTYFDITSVSGEKAARAAAR